MIGDFSYDPARMLEVASTAVLILKNVPVAPVPVMLFVSASP